MMSLHSKRCGLGKTVFLSHVYEALAFFVNIKTFVTKNVVVRAALERLLTLSLTVVVVATITQINQSSFTKNSSD